MPPLCVFSEQDKALVGWPDAISADPLMDLETYQSSFSIEFDQALNAHQIGKSPLLIDSSLIRKLR